MTELRNYPAMGHVMMQDQAMKDLESHISNSSRLWVFGYGSLVWKTGFSYERQIIGHVDGFVRRFWQGNTTHRGTPESPGRVATLVPKDTGRVWGVAFEVVGQAQIQSAMEHLGMRECLLGGYDVSLVSFHPRDYQDNAFPVIVFNALPSNPHFLGPASVSELANQVVSSKGPSGHNVEYVIRLADFVRDNIPEDTDEHLFGLESHIMEILKVDVGIESLYDINMNYVGYLEKGSTDNKNGQDAINNIVKRKRTLSGTESVPIPTRKSLPVTSNLISESVLMSQSA